MVLLDMLLVLIVNDLPNQAIIHLQTEINSQYSIYWCYNLLIT